MDGSSIEKIWFDEDELSPLNKLRALKNKNLPECFKREYCAYCSYCFAMALRENGYCGKSDVLCSKAKLYLKAAARDEV